MNMHDNLHRALEHLGAAASQLIHGCGPAYVPAGLVVEALRVYVDGLKPCRAVVCTSCTDVQEECLQCGAPITEVCEHGNPCPDCGRDGCGPRVRMVEVQS